MSKLSIIVAMDENRLIGNNGKLPWYIPWDLKYFKEKTMFKNIVMGRNTYESIGNVLPNRTNIVLTSDLNFKSEGCIVVNNIEDVLQYIDKSDIESFIIGGSSLYEQFIPLVDEMYINLIQHTFKGDSYFPSYDENDWDICTEETVEVTGDKTVYKIKTKHLIKKIKTQR
ncbi:dihydrofolate reductase [Paenibacillus barcinonensis]|uniref:Dihydrofolate reductase n=1 Tax=Paenibacillus barcinonensis TaxID=198119 RepID=A0A2V4WH20_PAEBA|nr:dihydrofolate reductase [Paenibacillus barcinonensis]PYE51450.1 dihydrofolate reductase [Paenibacillus barcinonensis]QKS55842.1 dihydrofolate reductase [Paenibacillus barcinonensis]